MPSDRLLGLRTVLGLGKYDNKWFVLFNYFSLVPSTRLPKPINYQSVADAVDDNLIIMPVLQLEVSGVVAGGSLAFFHWMVQCLAVQRWRWTIWDRLGGAWCQWQPLLIPHSPICTQTPSGICLRFLFANAVDSIRRFDSRRNCAQIWVQKRLWTWFWF